MSSEVRFSELGHILLTTGLTISRVYELTGVSRNTLAKMRDGGPVSTNSVSKLLNGLAEKHVLDVREYRAILERRMASPNRGKAVANGGVMLAVNNTANNKPGRRTAMRIAADLSERLKDCANLAAELTDALDDGDLDLQPDDARRIDRFHVRLNADLKEFYFRFGELISVAGDDTSRD